MEILNKLLGEKYICVFCDERMRFDKAQLISGKVGICRGCYKELAKTALSLPYPGTRSVKYIMSPFEYKGSLRKTILDFKFKNCRAYATLFARMMTEYLLSYDIWKDFDYIIPVPLHKGRLRERGYNQSELIAEYIADIIDVKINTAALSRIRATKRQSSLKRFDRIANVKGAFSCGEDLSDRNVLLFDDICTTGNTLQACAEELERAGAKNICALTLAIHTTEKLPVITY